jgi:hypothetical protein
MVFLCVWYLKSFKTNSAGKKTFVKRLFKKKKELFVGYIQTYFLHILVHQKGEMIIYIFCTKRKVYEDKETCKISSSLQI